MVAAACRYDLDHVPFYTGRGLYFQALVRLYKVFQEFCSSRGGLPLVYNKWLREQVAERLDLPELYQQLPQILEIPRYELPTPELLTQHRAAADTLINDFLREGGVAEPELQIEEEGRHHIFPRLGTLCASCWS